MGPVYPIISDANGVVLSMPPIINGEHSKMSAATRNVLIECTATNYIKAEIVLNTMLTMFGQYCAEPFTFEPVEIVYEAGHPFAGEAKVTPNFDMAARFAVRMSEIRNMLGLGPDGISPTQACELANKMMLQHATYDESTDRISVTA